jgi:hypothetical protein
MSTSPLPEFVTINNLRFEIIVLPHVRWHGEAVEYRVAYREHRLFVSASVAASDFPALLDQVREECRCLQLGAVWQPV